MRLKKIAVFFVMFLIMTATGVCVHAADFAVDTSVTPADTIIQGKYSLPKGQVSKPYSAQIQMAGGNAGYTFRFDSTAFVPPGLHISESGAITGTPTAFGSFRSINVYVEHTDGTHKIITFTVELDAKHVILVVKAPASPVYDGFTQYRASGQYKDEETGAVLTDKTPSLYYIKNGSRVDYALDAATYMIRYDIPLDLEVVSTEGDEFFTVARSNTAIVTARDKEVTYDGQPHGLTNEDITVTPAEAGHKEEYRRKGTSAYSSELPVAPGEYDVRVYTTSTNYEPSDTIVTLKITAQTVDFTVTNTSVPYNEQEQEPTITPSKTDANYTVTYKDSAGNILEGKPKNAGKYTIDINLVTNPSYPVIYVKGNVDNEEFEITPIEVSLKIPVKSYTYAAGTSYTPIVVPEPAGFDKYSVKYHLLDENSQLVNDAKYPASEISELGTYAVIFTLDDSVNYVFGTGNAQYVQVAEQTIDYKFKNLEKTYKRDTNQYAEVETTNGDFEGHYTLIYSQSGVQVTPQNAGTYYITIRPDKGYGTGTKDPEYPYLVINKQLVTFSLAEGAQTTVNYDGEGHTVTVQHNDESDILNTEYTVSYRNQATGEITSSAVKAGTYDVLVTITNNNYIAEEFNETLTVKSTVTLNMGNSPAAMIYKDSVHIDDAVWQTSTFEQLQTNREFTAENLPENCRASVKYPSITVDGKDLDTDVNTVIVSHINLFADPGVVINGEQRTSDENPVPVEGMDGLYKLTYTHEGVDYDRYIMVVRIIGDTNNDGYINALDANYLDDKNDAPNGVTEARIWDVNKDGILDKADATAIRGRFKTKLVPYYPWIYR